MAERVYVQWTIVNWITIVLMAAAGYAVLAFATQLYKARQGGGNG